MDTYQRIRDVIRTLPEMPGGELSRSPQQFYSIQRRGTRIRVRARTPVRLQLWDADLFDISLSGALVEHTALVRLGEIYRLAFPLEGREVQLRARAIRAFASHLVPLPGGERQLVYRTALEFVGLETGVGEILSAHTDQLHQPEAGGGMTHPAGQAPGCNTKSGNGETPTQGS